MTSIDQEVKKLEPLYIAGEKVKWCELCGKQPDSSSKYQHRITRWLSNSTPRCICATAKSLQLCPSLCDPIDGSPPGSPIPGILQARTLEWAAISFSNAWKWKVKVKSLSRVQLLVTPWTTAYQASPSMGFSRQEYWSRVPLPSPNGILLLCKDCSWKNESMRSDKKLVLLITWFIHSFKKEFLVSIMF